MGSFSDEIKVNVEEAIKLLQTAEEQLEEGKYQAAGSHAADSALHTARALLLDEEIETSKHGDVITLVQEIFVNGRRLTKEQGANLGWLFAMRKTGFQEMSQPGTAEEAQRAVEVSRSFFDAAKVILDG